jgi:hypothetical protein
MPELLDEIGLTEETLIEKHLVPLLSATTTKFFAHRGKVVECRKVPDNDARLKALDLAFRLKGSYASKGQETTEDRGIRVVVLDSPRPPRPALENGPTSSY